MPITTCPGCGSRTEFPVEQVGQEIQCPHCGASFAGQGGLSADPQAVGLATVVAIITVMVGVWWNYPRAAPFPDQTGQVGAEDPARFGGAPPPPMIQPGQTNASIQREVVPVDSKTQTSPDGSLKMDAPSAIAANATVASTANTAAQPAEVDLTPQQQLNRLERSVVRVRAKKDTSEEIVGGFIAGQDLVVTVRSQLRGARKVTIQFRDETFQDATGVIADDEQRGLVAVRVATERRPALRLVSALPEVATPVSAVAFAGNRTVSVMGQILSPAKTSEIAAGTPSQLSASFSNGVPSLGSPFLNARGDVVAIATGGRTPGSEIIPTVSGLEIQDVIARPAKQLAPFPSQELPSVPNSDKRRPAVDLSGSKAAREMLAMVKEVFVEIEPTRDDVTGRLGSIALLHFEQSFRNIVSIAPRKSEMQPVFRLSLKTERIDGEAEFLVQLVAAIVIPTVNSNNELVDTTVYQNKAVVGQISGYGLSKGNIPQSISDSIQGQADQLESLIRRLRRELKLN